jgi:subtilisin family serine protease
LEEAGAEVFDYIPEFAFIVRAAPERWETLRSLSGVRWVGPFRPEYRRSDALAAQAAAKGAQEMEWVIGLFPGEDAGRIRSAVESLGGTILTVHPGGRRPGLRVRVPANGLEAVSALDGVRWVEPPPRWQLFNNRSTDILNVRTPRNAHGLYGRDQIVGIADTGLDRGSVSPSLLHDDFEDGTGRSRVLRILDVAGDGEPGDPDGHGTHVAGSVLGSGIRSGCDPASNHFPDACFAGMAPKAEVVFQSVMNGDGSLALPWDLGDLFQQARKAGVRIHTNSWGSQAFSNYTFDSQAVDQYVWDHPDFLILFAAGNEGVDWDGDGVVDLGSLAAPATAKNCISVGASEGDRPPGSGAPDFAYGPVWGDDYSADPIFSDPVSDNPGGMVAFSSRGPCRDGRIKPDLVAPGTNILSTRSALALDDGWGPYDPHYLWMGGTSMSTPLAAGAATLLREYLVKEKGLTHPSAALQKAALLHAARDLSPGQYGTGPFQEIPGPPPPNPVQGWGLVDLGNAVYPSAGKEILHFDDMAGLQTGAVRDFRFLVSGAGSPLRAHLAWSDYPGSPLTFGGLVNDLDLQLVNPSGVPASPDPAGPDRLNNVEGLFVGSPQAGIWTARVSGYNVPRGPQPFGLVISGEVKGGVQITEVEPPRGGPGTRVTLHGINFGTRTPRIYFSTGGIRKKAKVLSHDDSQAVCLFPTKALYVPGPHDVELMNRKEKISQILPAAFTLLPPDATSSDKAAVRTAEFLSLVGAHFGTRKGWVYLENDALLPKPQKAGIDQWSDSSVTCRIPKALPPGDYTVRISNRVGSDTLEGPVQVTLP